MVEISIKIDESYRKYTNHKSSSDDSIEESIRIENEKLQNYNKVLVAY